MIEPAFLILDMPRFTEPRGNGSALTGDAADPGVDGFGRFSRPEDHLTTRRRGWLFGSPSLTLEPLPRP